MASVHSPVAPPAPGWAEPIPRDEKLFTWIVLASVAFMSAFTIGWLYLGKQNPPTRSYRTTPAAFGAQVSAFAAKYGKAGKVVVPPGKDAYLMAMRYTWFPELVLKAGHSYRIWMSSMDALHGFSLVGHGENINLEVAPNHAYGALFTPDKPGTYLIVCNEYCGLGHQAMKGHIVVER
jgi:cytochrome c oxidase subunit 2